MMLATRCPACRTTFKVVRDQLRLAEGWVRCGRCNEVFQAEEALTQWQPPSLPQGPAGQPAPLEPSMRWSEPAAPPSPPQSPPLASAGPHAPEPERPASPASNAAEPPPAHATPPSVAVAGLIEEPPLTSLTLPEPVPEPPADRHYVWESARERPAPPHPWVTAAWALTALAGLTGLLIQSAVAWHDELAQSTPALRPALEVTCVMLDCKIEPVRRIEALSVESSQLTQLGGTIYQFTATLRNRATVELSAPALDLVLSSSDGQVIARKVLRWADFGLRNRSMAAQQELTLQTNLNTGSATVAGFTIELFYP